MRRVAVVGCSGAGKSTFARRLAEKLDRPHVELDAIFHQPDWGELPTPEFRAAVADRIVDEGWVIDGNYSAVWDLIAERADTIVFLDPPRWRVMAALTRRTAIRLVTREELWNGNREEWRNVLSRDDHRNILLWAWRHHASYRRRWADVPIRLRSRREIATFLANAQPTR